MKKIISALSFIGLSGAILCSTLLVQSDWGFSLLFKLLFIFISLFIVSVAVRASNFGKVTSVIGLVCFGGTIVIFSATDLYLTLWNFILAGHVLLIGYVFYKGVGVAPSSALKSITSISIVITIPIFVIVILLKSQNELIFTCLFFLLVLTSTLLVVSKITSLLNQK